MDSRLRGNDKEVIYGKPIKFKSSPQPRQMGDYCCGPAAGLIAGNFVYGWTAPGPLDREVTVVIKPGSSITLAAESLEKGGVIKSADAFVNRAKIFGATSTIKAGELSFLRTRVEFGNPRSILTGGKTVQRMVTIPEGMPSIMVL